MHSITNQTKVAGEGAEQLAEVFPPFTAIPVMGCTKMSSTVTLTLPVVREPWVEHSRNKDWSSRFGPFVDKVWIQQINLSSLFS